MLVTLDAYKWENVVLKLITIWVKFIIVRQGCRVEPDIYLQLKINKSEPIWDLRKWNMRRLSTYQHVPWVNVLFQALLGGTRCGTSNMSQYFISFLIVALVLLFRCPHHHGVQRPGEGRGGSKRHSGGHRKWECGHQEAGFIWYQIH